MESKSRILYLLRILEQYTDEEHPLTTRQLIERLQENYGISAHRTTLSKDIEALQEFGIDIVIIHSTQCKYFIGSRLFELPERKLLIDAVESSKFITGKKSDALIKKIHTLTRVYDRLTEEHDYTGSYSMVQRYLKKCRMQQVEKANRELVWDPGPAQVDFGEANFYEAGKPCRKNRTYKYRKRLEGSPILYHEYNDS